MLSWKTRKTAKRTAAAVCLTLLLLTFAAPVSADGAAGTEKTTENPPAAGKTEQSPDDSRFPVNTTTGTAILVGAGAYTYVRTKWQEKKRLTNQ